MQSGETTRMFGSPPPSQADGGLQFPPGTLIGGRYGVVGELGRGGYGIVLDAVHIASSARVAIKVLTRVQGSTDAEWQEDRARFSREALATAALQSRYVVQVMAVDVLASGHPYFVMERLEGKTLHDVVHASSGSVPIEWAVDVTMHILAALSVAHEKGVVHRDLKPPNIFLGHAPTGDLAVKVLDFGVSKMMTKSVHTLTGTGAVVGTFAYMAPEQLRSAKHVDGRADLWSVGMMLLETLWKRHPFGNDADKPTVVNATLQRPVALLRTERVDAPEGLERAIARLVEKLPEQRFSTAYEAACALAPFASERGRRILSEMHRGAAMPQPTPRRKMYYALIGISIAVLLVALVWASGVLGPKLRLRRKASFTAPSPSAVAVLSDPLRRSELLRHFDDRIGQRGRDHRT